MNGTDPRTIAQLKPSEFNPREITASAIAGLKESVAEFGDISGIVYNRTLDCLVAGHQRVEALRAKFGSDLEIVETEDGNGKIETPAGSFVVRFVEWDRARTEAAMVAANNPHAQGDWNAGAVQLVEGLQSSYANLFNDLQFDKLLQDIARGNENEDKASGPTKSPGSVKEKFIMAPFSVLNAREGEWQDRKRAWLSFGIKSEVGRGAKLLDMSASQAGITDKNEIKRWNANRKANRASPGGSAMPATDYSKSGCRGNGSGKAIPGTAKGLLHAGKTIDARNGEKWEGVETCLQNEGTSIFDPVLCELAYCWFSGEGAQVVDPFAGGSVRGIVASHCGRKYWGCDLRAEQIEANVAQGEVLCAGILIPEWVCGDALNELPKSPEADFVFSCPPYGDLEQYSDDPADISAMEWSQFLKAYREIIRLACAKLRNNRFACFVVGDFRNERGVYRNFVSETIQAFDDAGLSLYNEAILVTAIGSGALRVTKQFTASRKLCKTHQNVLVFVKGDAKTAAKHVKQTTE